MKSFVILLIAALVVITISCSDKGSGGGSSGFPTIPDDDDWAWPQSGINTVVQIYAYPDKDGYVEVYVVHFSENVPQSCVIKINNDTIATPDSSDWDHESWWIDSLHVYDSYEYWDEVYISDDIDPGAALTYSVKINNTTDTGSLKIPYQVYGSFPDFDVEENYHFTWNIQQNPDLHYVFFYIDDDWEYVNKNWQLSGSTRDYTINKSIYQDFAGDDYWVDVILYAMTYDRTGDFLAFTFTEDWYYNDYDGLKLDIEKRKLHRQRLLKALLHDLQDE